MNYSNRLFNKTEINNLSGTQKKTIANHMLELGQNNKERQGQAEDLLTENLKSDRNIDVGYTYFGQFISHDIIPPTNPSQPIPERIVSPILNMDSLYGTKEQYKTIFDSEGLFRLCQKYPHDLLRNATGNANLPESRNDENIIIAQYHLLWQKIHNKVISLLDNTPSGEQKNLKAKSITIALFHYLTTHDFLKKILHKDVYKKYFEEYNKYILQEQHTFDALPFEFTHAVFRFGHSLILNAYTLNKDTNPAKQIILKKLLQPKGGACIAPEHAIQWELFFGKCAKDANNIDLTIAHDMSNIPTGSKLQHERNIVQLNLVAGERAYLPNATEIVTNIKNTHPKLHLALIKNNINDIATTFNDTGASIPGIALSSSLPLWMHTLADARDHKLGIIASIVVAETLRKSIFEFYKNEKYLVRNSELKEYKDIESHIKESIPINIQNIFQLNKNDFDMSTLIKRL